MSFTIYNVNVNISRTQAEDPRNAKYWFCHPIYRGIGAGIVAKLLTSSTLFYTGFVYGFLSGITNIALRTMFKEEITVKASTKEGRALKYIGIEATTWTSSFVTMHFLEKFNNDAVFNLGLPAAIGIGILGLACGRANNDILNNE